MTIDLTGYEIVDSHCHPFLPEKETEGFEQYFTLSMLPMRTEDMKNTLLYRMMLKELARVLELGEEAKESKVLEKRYSLYRSNPREYIARLFSEARIESLILDIGYPSEEFTGYSIDMKEFLSILRGTKVNYIVRIEPMINRLLKQELRFSEFVNQFTGQLDAEIKKHKAVAVKSIIAYLTGLGVEKVTMEEARKGYDEYLAQKNDFKAEKLCRDYLFWLTLEICIKWDIPLQLHTGMGDSPVFDLRLSNPLSLYNIISDDYFQKSKIVLVHAGYPYVAEAGYLANNYPNVWVDISEVNPFASIGVEPKLLELMESAPLTKIMYGSDGFMIPEIFWFGGIFFKKVLSRVLGKLVNEEIISLDYAHWIARSILKDNAQSLYQLQTQKKSESL
ncbi:MAG: amidohydrolase family protein [Chloroflexota bacterium]